MEVLMEKQRAVDEALAANSAAINEIEEEMKMLIKKPHKRGSPDGNEDYNIERKIHKCRYYDRGHCKYKRGCKYFHPRDICKYYLDNGKCMEKSCVDRHPKVCKFWSKSKAGCKRGQACDFIHVTLAQHDDVKENSEIFSEHVFQCVGCKSSWDERKFVVQHNISNQIINFCLNCNDWIKDKSKVLEANWTMFDDKGDLRYDV